MNTKIEDKRLKDRAIESFLKSKNAQTKTMSKDIVVKSNKKYASLLGFKITTVKFQNKEYLLKANRYLLVIVFKYLVERNKIDLKKELPLKNHDDNERCLLNRTPFHTDGNEMRDILKLETSKGLFYIESKLDTNAIQNSCFNLLRRYNIPMDGFEVRYAKKRAKVHDKYKAKLNRQGYCLVDDSSISSAYIATKINNGLVTNKN